MNAKALRELSSFFSSKRTPGDCALLMVENLSLSLIVGQYVEYLIRWAFIWLKLCWISKGLFSLTVKFTYSRNDTDSPLHGVGRRSLLWLKQYTTVHFFDRNCSLVDLASFCRIAITFWFEPSGPQRLYLWAWRTHTHTHARTQAVSLFYQ